MPVSVAKGTGSLGQGQVGPREQAVQEVLFPGTRSSVGVPWEFLSEDGGSLKQRTTQKHTRTIVPIGGRPVAGVRGAGKLPRTPTMEGGQDGAGADGAGAAGGRKRWPGWPGDNVFRLLVSEAKVGVIIGRRGESVKRICDETKARVKIVDPLPGIEERVVSLALPSSPPPQARPQGSLRLAA